MKHFVFLNLPIINLFHCNLLTKLSKILLCDIRMFYHSSHLETNYQVVIVCLTLIIVIKYVLVTIWSTVDYASAISMVHCRPCCNLLISGVWSAVIDFGQWLAIVVCPLFMMCKSTFDFNDLQFNFSDMSDDNNADIVKNSNQYERHLHSPTYTPCLTRGPYGFAPNSDTCRSIFRRPIATHVAICVASIRQE